MIMLVMFPPGITLYKTSASGEITSVTSISNYTNPINIYPNPADKKINIVNLGNENYSVTICNSFGRIFYQTQLSQKNESVNEIKVEDLPGGIYFITFIGKEGLKSGKFLVEHY